MELGYGNDKKNWELKMYENQRRNLKKMERIEVVKKRKEMINPKTEVKTDIPLGKIEDAF